MIGPSLHIDIVRLEWPALWNTLNADCERLLNVLNEFVDLSGDTGKVVSLVFTDDEKVQELNYQFRQKDQPTNVLSFPNDADTELGDVILALETVQQEAREQGKSFIGHATHLVLHGFLHLLGYDHIEEADTQEMEALEIEILAGMGIDDPY